MTIRCELWVDETCLRDDVSLEAVPANGAHIIHDDKRYMLLTQEWRFTYSGFSDCTKVSLVILRLKEFTQ